MHFLVAAAEEQAADFDRESLGAFDDVAGQAVDSVEVYENAKRTGGGFPGEIFGRDGVGGSGLAKGLSHGCRVCLAADADAAAGEHRFLQQLT